MKKPMSLLAMFLAGAVMAAIPLPEHPRPDFERPHWLNLNGDWKFRFEKAGGEQVEGWQKIVVPFGWGTKLSGVKDEGDTGIYRREITVPAEWKGKRVFVVVGAADHDTTCTFDGDVLGKHTGGYTPFEFELTELIRWGEKQPLEFKVWDPPPNVAMNGHYLYGKQGYTNVRGIWQTVYLEARGDEYVESIQFVPDIKNGQVAVVARLAAPAKSKLKLKLEEKAGGGSGLTKEVEFKPGSMVAFDRIKIEKPRLWTLEDPYLYEVKATLGDDEVNTYFGMREIGTARNAIVGGAPYVTLNGKPIYLQLTLDQSWNLDGGFTYPSDEMMRREIEISKQLALNGNRIHIKAEQPRKLYWADKLGLLIQADVPCAWGVASEQMFEEHWKCFEGMAKRDFNHPCIYQWTLFNETWGLLSNRSLKPGLAAGGGKKRAYRDWTQRAVAEYYLKAKQYDPTRLVEDMSACNHDHVITDVNSWHCYTMGDRWKGILDGWCRDTVGGSTHNFIGGHVQDSETPMMNSECGNVWGYSGSTGDCDYTWDYHWMMNAFRRHPKCCGFLYTEHHDVINEWNGYVRADRTWKETGIEELFPGMSLKDLHGKAFIAVGNELCREAKAGEKWKVPVDISLVTDEYAGKKCTLEYALRYFDGEGVLRNGEAVKVELLNSLLTNWRHGTLAEAEIQLPNETAAGTVNFTLAIDGKAIARNFVCFTTAAAADLQPVSQQWSHGSKAILGGLKHNGFGSGYFEFELPVTSGASVFRAEISTKRINGKDMADAKAKGEDLDWMLGGGGSDRSKNPNSYPQTSTQKLPGKVKVSADGVLLGEVALADDPADHRGILSWNSQVKKDGKVDKRLNEAGSYGYLVEREIPAEVLQNAKGGKVRIRLEAEKTGLAVYGAAFGRYPFGPHIGKKR